MLSVHNRYRQADGRINIALRGKKLIYDGFV